MVRAEFTQKDNRFIGFRVSGHAGAGISGNDIVCAGVTSAVMLTVNTVTEFFNADAEVDVDEKDNAVSLMLNSPYDETSVKMIESFYSHLDILKQEYKHIDLKVTKG